MNGTEVVFYSGLLSFVSCWVYVWVMRRRAVRRAVAEHQAAIIRATATHWTDGRTPEQVEAQAAQEAFEAAWIEPNKDFIRETDRILNDIEWNRLTAADQAAKIDAERAKAALEKDKHAEWHRSAPGIYACCINVGPTREPAPLVPAEPSFGKHDQGEAVFG